MATCVRAMSNLQLMLMCSVTCINIGLDGHLKHLSVIGPHRLTCEMTDLDVLFSVLHHFRALAHV